MNLNDRINANEFSYDSGPCHDLMDPQPTTLSFDDRMASSWARLLEKHRVLAVFKAMALKEVDLHQHPRKDLIYTMACHMIRQGDYTGILDNLHKLAVFIKNNEAGTSTCWTQHVPILTDHLDFFYSVNDMLNYFKAYDREAK